MRPPNNWAHPGLLWAGASSAPAGQPISVVTKKPTELAGRTYLGAQLL